MATPVTQFTAADKRRKAGPSDLHLVVTVEQLLQAYEIEEWDAVVIGDGSGTTREHSCGWGSILIENGVGEGHRLFSGSLSSGTNNVAEIMAVLQPLMDLTSRKRGVGPHGCRVHVFSDSSYVVDGLNTRFGVLQVSTTESNRELWLALFGARRNGLVITAHHVPRDVLAYQQICHNMANACRKSQREMKHNVVCLDSLNHFGE